MDAPPTPAASDPDTPAPAVPRPRRPSLRARLTVWMVVITLVIQLTLGLVVFLYQTSALSKLFDTSIRDRTEPLAAEIENGDAAGIAPHLAEVSRRRLVFNPGEPRAVILMDARGNPIAEASPFPLPDGLGALIVNRSTRPGATFRREVTPAPGAPAATWRFISRRLMDRTGATYFLVVAGNDQSFDTMLALIRRILVLSIPVGIIGAGVAAWLVSGLAIAPVRRLRAIANTLAPERIERSAPLDVGIAELEDVQAVLTDVRDRIRNAFMARDRFIANVSHELKTPIAVILTEAQTLDARGLNTETKAFVRSVIDETRRLNRTIETFLTVTKIRAGRSLMEHAPCSVSDFVMDAVLQCTRMARRHGVTINPLLAEEEHPRELVGDCELLRVMTENLLRNAVRFSPPGAQVLVHVTVSTTEVLIAVRDFGGPVPPGPVVATPEENDGEHQPASARRGTTVGLSIAEAIAELHAGQITASNIASGGCEFVVRLPCEPLTNGRVDDAARRTAGVGEH